MANMIGKYAANKLLGKQMDKYKSKQVETGAVSQAHPSNQQLHPQYLTFLSCTLSRTPTLP